MKNTEATPNAATIKYRGMVTVWKGPGYAPRLIVKAETERQVWAKIARATDRMDARGEARFSWLDIITTQLQPGLWECKLICPRDAIIARGQFYEMDGTPS